jgi:hypothetical protein
MKDFMHGQPLPKSEPYETEILRLATQNDITTQSFGWGIHLGKKEIIYSFCLLLRGI